MSNDEPSLEPEKPGDSTQGGPARPPTGAVAAAAAVGGFLGAVAGVLAAGGMAD